MKRVLVLTCVMLLLTGCGFVGYHGGYSDVSKKQDDSEQEIDFDELYEQAATSTPDEITDASKEAYNGSGVPDELSDEVLAEYLETLKPADDEYDFRFACDYQYHDMLNMVECNDSKCYEKVFGHADVTLEEIKEVLDENPYIAKMYFKKYVTDDMTKEEAEKVFDAFYEEITFNFENMNRKYTIDENTFLPTFEAYLGTLGIE